jgi:hypothetical protein
MPEILLSIEEIDERLAARRENLRELIEQAAAYSGAADEDLISRRIAEQEAELELLTRERDKLAQFTSTSRPHGVQKLSKKNEKSNRGVKKHMEVIGADGVHIGTVDHVENDRIKLAKTDSGEGRHQGHHHFIKLGLVADIEGQTVRLSANAAVAVTLEEEESGTPT